MTIPAGLLVAHAIGMRPRLQDGLLVGLGMLAVDLIVLLAVSAIVLIGLAIGERVHPHELTADSLELRSGTLYRASIPLRQIESVTRIAFAADDPPTVEAPPAPSPRRPRSRGWLASVDALGQPQLAA